MVYRSCRFKVHGVQLRQIIVDLGPAATLTQIARACKALGFRPSLEIMRQLRRAAYPGRVWKPGRPRLEVQT